MCAGLIGIGEPKSLLTASSALNAFHVPVISVDPAVFNQVGNSFHILVISVDPAVFNQVGNSFHILVISVDPAVFNQVVQ